MHKTAGVRIMFAVAQQEENGIRHSLPPYPKSTLDQLLLRKMAPPPAWKMKYPTVAVETVITVQPMKWITVPRIA